jgi:D-citramalate synthase
MLTESKSPLSEGEFQGVKGIMAWARPKDTKTKFLTFVDGGLSIEWMKKAGGSKLLTDQ